MTGSISYWYRTDTASQHFLRFRYEHNGSWVSQSSATGYTDWTQRSRNLAPGVWTVEWAYHSNNGGHNDTGAETAWIAGIEVEGGHIVPPLRKEQAVGAEQVGVGTVGDPVNTATGDLVEHVTDLAVVDLGGPIAVGRSYNSGDDRAGVLGRGWRASFEMDVTVDGDTGAATVAHPSGRQVVYQDDGSGGYVTPAGVPEDLAEVDGQFRLATANVEFGFDDEGLVEEIVSLAASRTVTFQRDYDGRVVRISGPTRHIDLAYTSDGLLDTAEASDGRIVTYGYTSDGLLETVTSPASRTTTYSYHPGGRLASATAPDGTVIHETDYDATTGWVVAQRDSAGEEMTFTYDVSGLWTGTVTATDAAGGQWVDRYVVRTLVARTDPTGVETTYNYDSNLRLIGYTTPDGANALTYDGDGRLIETDTPFGAHATTYTSGGLKAQSTGADSTTADYGHDQQDRLVSVVRRGGETTFTYTANDVLETVTDPADHTTVLEHNAQGQPTKITAPDQSERLFTYTPEGRLATVTDSTGTITYTYDDDGLVTSITDPDDRTTTYGYDPAGRLSSITDHDERTTTYAYDSAGRLSNFTDHADRTVSYTYDTLSRLASVTDVADRTASFSYDAAGRLTQVEDLQGTVSKGYRDGRLFFASRLDGSSVGYSYSDRGAVVEIAARLATAAEPVVVGVSKVAPASGSTRSLPVPAGTLPGDHLVIFAGSSHGGQELLTPDGWAHLRHDTVGSSSGVSRQDVILRTLQDEDILTGQIDLEWSGTSTVGAVAVTIRGGLAAEHSGNAAASSGFSHVSTDVPSMSVEDGALLIGAATTWHDFSNQYADINLPSGWTEHDNSDHRLGIVIGEDIADGVTTGDLTFSTGSFRWNPSIAAAVVVFEHDPEGDDTDLDAVAEHFAYDTLGRIETHTRGSTTLTYGYGSDGRVAEITVSDPELGVNETTSYSYDSRGFVNEITRPDSTVDAFDYDSNGRLSAVWRDSDLIAQRTYDNAGRLIKVELADGTTQAYSYDSLSRPVTRTVEDDANVVLEAETIHYDDHDRPVRIDTNSTSVAFEYTDLGWIERVCYDRVECDGSETDWEAYTYDAVGNRLTRTTPGGTDTYHYNALDQLTHIDHADQTTTSYSYDDTGRVTTIGDLELLWDPVTDQLAGAEHSDGRTWEYQYDPAGRLLHAAVTEPGYGTDTLAYSRDPLFSELVSRDDGTAASRYLPMGLGRHDGADLILYHHDHLGSLRLATNEQGPVAAWHYDPWGVREPASTPDPGVELGYGGHLAGPDGLLLMAGRAYEPATGRFLALDPAGAGYIYANNAPLRYTDPSGHIPCIGDWDRARRCAATVNPIADTVALAAGAVTAGAAVTGIGAPVAAVTGPIALGAGAIGTLARGVHAADACIHGKGSCASEVTTVAAAVALSRVRLPTGSSTNAAVSRTLPTAPGGAADDAVSIISRTAQAQSARGVQGLQGHLSPPERAAFAANPAGGSRFLGQAVHRGTRDALQEAFPGRFLYRTRGIDFVDKWTGQMIELTTPGQVASHMARPGYRGASYATYQLPQLP